MRVLIQLNVDPGRRSAGARVYGRLAKRDHRVRRAGILLHPANRLGLQHEEADKIVALVREAISKSSALPSQRTVTVAEVLPACEKCGELSPDVYDLFWFTSLLMYVIRKSDRRVLCRPHGAGRVRIVTVYNLTFGNLGIGLLASPVISYRNIKTGQQNGAIGRVEATVWMVFVTWPYLLVAAALASVVRFVVMF